MVDLPCGTHNYSYATDMAIVRTKTQWGLLAALFIFAITLPLYGNNYLLSILNEVGYTLIVVLGLNIMMGYCGQISLGHAAFMAVGAYTSAILTTRLGLPFLAGFICAGFAAGLVGLIFGLPSLRVKGFYLVIATLAAQFIITWAIVRASPLTKGALGMAVPYASIGGFTFETEAHYFYLIWAVAGICIFFCKNLARTRLGRAFVAVRDNDLAAEVMGINLFYHKLLAFFLGCFLAGLGGCLFAHYIGLINASEGFTLMDSILYVGILVIGGLGTILGPILGTFFIIFLKHGLMLLVPLIGTVIPGMKAAFSSAFDPLVFGLVIVLFLILEPRGLAHRWSLFKASYRLWPFSY